MASLFITYWSGTDRSGGNSPGNIISSEVRSISGTSAQSGATPEGAKLVSIYADAAAVFEYGANPTADSAASAYLGANERLWTNARQGALIAGKTA
jgi:hypothetical protein